MDVNLWWGDVDHRAKVGIKSARREPRSGRQPALINGRPIYMLRNIEMTLSGESAHEYGRVKVEGGIDIQPDELLQLFDVLLQSAKGQTNLKRAIRALVAEIDFDV